MAVYATGWGGPGMSYTFRLFPFELHTYRRLAATIVGEGLFVSVDLICAAAPKSVLCFSIQSSRTTSGGFDCPSPHGKVVGRQVLVPRVPDLTVQVVPLHAYPAFEKDPLW